LSQNYPNPFNPETKIEFSIPDPAPVRLTVFNTLGQIIRVLVDDELAAGQHSVTWDGSDDLNHPVASGMYLYRIEAGSQTETRKMILTK
jgi:flagellar hook assembly protein FlgD